MFNFLNSKLSPKIVSRSPAMDNYEVDNLISDNYISRKRGFIAYSAIKPPVEIEIEFICAINIYYIILGTTVGSQKCTGIEIMARNSKKDYTTICKALYDNPGVVFCNSKKYSKNNVPPKYISNYHLAFFRSNTFHCFLNATSIKIIIFRTEKSVPCLGSIEVWGETSKNCSEVTKNTIIRLMQKPIQNVVSDAANPDNMEFRIPEDFKDDLTYEIMSLPMTLPSGKTVDQNTLEKHKNSEISFGRKPCDPFTGIKFSDTLKPVLNVALKSRIDMFLLQNSDREELLNVKRTLGGGVQYPCSSDNGRKRKREGGDDETEELILKAMESPGYVSFTSESSGNGRKCTKCKAEGVTMYEIPCKHFYCRGCVLTMPDCSKCLNCDENFSRIDFSKCNF